MKCFLNFDKYGVFENRVLYCKYFYSGKKKILIWLFVVKKKIEKKFFLFEDIGKYRI